MTVAVEILNLLLDRYQRSGHCLPGKSSNRRVALSLLGEKGIPYRENDPQVSEMNASLLALAEEGLISYNWRKGYEGWLLDKVWLNLDVLPLAYEKAGRTPLADSASRLYRLFETFAERLRTPWKIQYVRDEMDSLEKRLRTSRHLSGKYEQAEAVLKVLLYTEQGPSLPRVISVNCFHDSKYLEQNLFPALLSIAKAYEPELRACRAVEDEDEKGRDNQNIVLAQLGILASPEIFEFCGSVQLDFPDARIDVQPFQKGFCLRSENLDLLSRICADRIRSVILIENYTNYRALLLRGIPSDQLVIFHGGFYSPEKKILFQFFEKILPRSAEIHFWGDIDLGGFLMFTRLKKNIFPKIQPFRMGLEAYNQYCRLGLKRSPDYMKKLRARLEDGAFDEIFFPQAREILEKRATVEQEIML